MSGEALPAGAARRAMRDGLLTILRRVRELLADLAEDESLTPQARASALLEGTDRILAEEQDRVAGELTRWSKPREEWEAALQARGVAVIGDPPEGEAR